MDLAQVMSTRKSAGSSAWGMLPVFLVLLAALVGCAPDRSASSPNTTDPASLAAESPSPGAAESEPSPSYEFPSDPTPQAREKRLAEMKSLRFQGIYRAGPKSRDSPPRGVYTICTPLGPVGTSPQQLAVFSDSYTFVPDSTIGYAVRWAGLAKIDLETGRFKQVLAEGLLGQQIHRIAFDTKRHCVVMEAQGNLQAYYPEENKTIILLQEGFPRVSAYDVVNDRLIGLDVSNTGKATLHEMGPSGEAISQKELAGRLPVREGKIWRISYHVVVQENYLLIQVLREITTPWGSEHDTLCYVLNRAGDRVLFSGRMTPQSTGGTWTAAGPPDALPLAEALQKAQIGTKYGVLLRKIEAPEDYKIHSAFHDFGYYCGTQWAGYHDLPEGYYVYVYPTWYVWRDLVGTIPPDEPPRPTRPMPGPARYYFLGPPTEAGKLFDRANAAYTAGQHEEAVKLWQQTIADHEGTEYRAPALLALAAHEAEHNQLSRAIALANQVFSTPHRGATSVEGRPLPFATYADRERAYQMLVGWHKDRGEYQEAAKYSRILGEFPTGDTVTLEDHRRRMSEEADRLLEWHRQKVFEPPRQFSAMLNGLVIAGGGDAAQGILDFLARFDRLYVRFSPIRDSGLRQLEKLPHLKGLNLYNTEITDAGLAHLVGLRQLERLELGDTLVTDAGLAHLRDHTKMRDLSLVRCKITDAGMVHLGRMLEMERLSLMQTGVTDRGLRPLRRMQNMQDLVLPDRIIGDAGMACLREMSRLKHLSVIQGKITDQGIANLKGMKQLEVLYIGGNPFGNKGLAYLSGARKLQKLDIWGTNVDSRGLAHLKDLDELRELTLSKTKVDDAGMVHLVDLDSLTELGLLYTRVTPEGIRKLKGHPTLKHIGVSHEMMTSEQSKTLNRVMAPIKITHYAN